MNSILIPLQCFVRFHITESLQWHFFRFSILFIIMNSGRCWCRFRSVIGRTVTVVLFQMLEQFLMVMIGMTFVSGAHKMDVEFVIQLFVLLERKPCQYNQHRSLITKEIVKILKI